MSAIPSQTRLDVHARDQDRCVRCCTERPGWLGWQIHHRKPRGRSGRHGLANLVLLCASCHAEIESCRLAAYTAGYLVRTEQDPAGVPVIRHGLWEFLADDGTTRPVEEDAA